MVPSHLDVAGAESGDIDPGEHRLAAKEILGLRTMAAGAIAGVEALCTLARLRAPAGLRVDRQGEHRTPGGFGAADEFLSDFPPRGRIKLIPRRPAESSGDVFYRSVGGGGENLQRVLLLCRARDWDLAL